MNSFDRGTKNLRNHLFCSGSSKPQCAQQVHVLPVLMLLPLLTFVSVAATGGCRARRDPPISAPVQTQQTGFQADRPFHSDPPREPLPATLDATNFTFSRSAYVAYALAGKVRAILYQEPCHCLCGKYSGHKSLLDCFVSEHGVQCGVCQQEVIFCFEKYKAGKTASQIRESISREEFRTVDLVSYADSYLASTDAK
jgi:hypothetical protein